MTIQIRAEPLREAKCSECGQLLDLSREKPLSKVACPSCGAQKTVPGRFAEYLILELLGSGGMGAVYRGLDPLLDRQVALKVLLKSLRDNPELRARFRREAKSAANINHPNVTHVYAFGEEEGQPYIVMEYVDGCSLDFLIGQETALDQQFLVETGIQIAKALQAGIKKGLVHGDVKPENILFNSDFTAKLIDFGLASLVDEDVKGGVWGSPYYLSPEQVRRLPTDERSDIYSLGATLYHAAAGCPPFDGETAVEVLKARLDHPPKPMQEIRPDIHPSVERVIGRMMNLDVTRRHSDYATLIADLQNALKHLTEPDKAHAEGDAHPIKTKKIQAGRKATQVRKRAAAYASSSAAAEAKAFPATTRAGAGHARRGRKHDTSQRRRRASYGTQTGLKRTTGRLDHSLSAPSSSGGGKIFLVMAFIALGALLGWGIIRAGSQNSEGPRPPTRPSQPTRPAQQGPTPGARPEAATPALTLRQDRLTPCRGYGGRGTATVSDGGRTLTLRGPVWRAHPFSYAIRPNTVLEFEFSSGREGLFQGIGLSQNSGARPERIFQLYGTRRAGGIRGYEYADAAPGRKRYRIPVGQHYRGQVLFLLFANDDHTAANNAESVYSNIRVFESP